MQWRNTAAGYGVVSIAAHWLIAGGVIGLFALGWWMVDLTYYDPWYRQAPSIHKAVGVLLFILLVGRLAWRWGNPRPRPLGRPLERRLARLVHGLFYLLLFAVMIAGYLISTADGSSIDVFGLFAVPATLSDLPNQEDIAGNIHRWLAWTVMGLTVVHASAAFKHHLIDRDRTLVRMLRPTSSHSATNEGDPS
ncbi:MULTISPECIES: cytochrome b [unclassified Guyparkeria]|uniref:cytochrome b n=1 Tax=unclassified Guyparkeria TaxID=2626246 RepID=UPI0007333FB1|nr:MULTISPECIES: cytochrome b [unclassified Guyparkeria]KTG16341.1 cytochrome B [Guyparkeria sp. XI15]OAE85281.1 cytochrome B [Guyparkeria sp. WRN-7]